MPAGILQNLDCYSITIGGVEDHIHIGCAITKKHAPMKVLEYVKKDSSKWLKTLSPTFHDFHWQDGYGLFSVSSSHFDPLKKYIMNQVEHHKIETFQEEFIKLLRKNGVSFDEQYLWD
jgi:putative transposase